MLEKLRHFCNQLFFEPCSPKYRQLIIYCTLSRLSSDEYSKKIGHVSIASSNETSEVDYDIWVYNCNQDKLLLMCDDFSEMDEIYEEAVYGGIPTSSICNRDNNIMLLAIGPTKEKVIDELINRLNKLKNQGIFN